MEDHFDQEHFKNSNITFVMGIVAVMVLFLCIATYVNVLNAVINTSYKDHLALYESLRPGYSSLPIVLK